MASVSLILDKNLFPRPSPLLAPLTKPAISTILTVVGINFSGLISLLRASNLLSGTLTILTLGSIVQNG